MLYSIVMFSFSVFDWKYFFLDKFSPKNQNYLFKVKFGTKTNVNMSNSMMIIFDDCGYDYDC